MCVEQCLKMYVFEMWKDPEIDGVNGLDHAATLFTERRRDILG